MKGIIYQFINFVNNNATILLLFDIDNMEDGAKDAIYYRGMSKKEIRKDAEKKRKEFQYALNNYPTGCFGG